MEAGSESTYGGKYKIHRTRLVSNQKKSPNITEKIIKLIYINNNV